MNRLEALKIARIVYSEMNALREKWKGCGAIDYLYIDLQWTGNISVGAQFFEERELRGSYEDN